jgi:hypothetical protein
MDRLCNGEKRTCCQGATFDDSRTCAVNETETRTVSSIKRWSDIGPDKSDKFLRLAAML